jgi:prophage regulatory protein
MSDDRMFRKSEVRALTTLSDSTLKREEEAGRFPRRVRLSRRAVGWRAGDVLAWLKRRAERS